MSTPNVSDSASSPVEADAASIDQARKRQELLDNTLSTMSRVENKLDSWQMLQALFIRMRADAIDHIDGDIGLAAAQDLNEEVDLFVQDIEKLTLTDPADKENAGHSESSSNESSNKSEASPDQTGTDQDNLDKNTDYLHWEPVNISQGNLQVLEAIFRLAERAECWQTSEDLNSDEWTDTDSEIVGSSEDSKQEQSTDGGFI